MFLFYFCFIVIIEFSMKQNSVEINDSFHLHLEICIFVLRRITYVLAVEHQ